MTWETYATKEDIKRECLTEEAIKEMDESKREDITHPFRTTWMPLLQFSIFVGIVIMGTLWVYVNTI